MCLLREMLTWCGFSYSLSFSCLILPSLPSALLGINPKAGHVGGMSHNECFFHKTLMAVHWYWEVVRKSFVLWLLLLAVLLIANLVYPGVELSLCLLSHLAEKEELL